MQWGGWASEKMLRCYAHLAPEAIDHYIDLIAPECGDDAPDPQPDPTD